MHGLNRCSLFVGDLAIFCTELDLERVFTPFGNIAEIKIMRSEETYRNLSYGFVKFSSFESAQQAMNALDGVLLCGRPMRVRWASFKNRDTKDMKSEGLDTSPVHVSFISYQIDRLVTEQTLRALFSRYGDVVDVSIKKSMIDKDIDRQSGYGFVHYAITPEGVDSAILAAQQLQDTTIDEVNYKSSLAHSLSRYLNEDTSLQSDITPISRQDPHNSISMNNHPQIMVPPPYQGSIPNSQQYSQFQTVSPPQFVGYSNQQAYPSYPVSQQGAMYNNGLLNLNTFMASPVAMTRYSYGNIPQEIGTLPQTSSPQSVASTIPQSITAPAAAIQQGMVPSGALPRPQMSLPSPPLSSPVPQVVPVLTPSINGTPVMLPSPSMSSMYSTQHVVPTNTTNTMYGPDLAYNVSTLTLSPLPLVAESSGGVAMISSPQINYSPHPYGVGYFNSPIIVVPSPRSTDVRDEQLTFVNVNHLLQSPTASPSASYYLPNASGMLPYGTVAFPMPITENNNGKISNGGSTSSPHSPHGSTPSTPSSSFNSDVVMVQAAVKNEKIAAKSSIRTLSNSYRKKLNPTDEVSSTVKVKDQSLTSDKCE